MCYEFSLENLLTLHCLSESQLNAFSVVASETIVIINTLEFETAFLNVSTNLEVLNGRYTQILRKINYTMNA